nr:MAG TPA: hypothetical protein [Bacteriophage sp.]
MPSRKKAYISRNMDLEVYINSKNLTNFASQKETKGKLTRVYFPRSPKNVKTKLALLSCKTN